VIELERSATIQAKNLEDLIDFGSKWAVLVGINKYSDQVISDLNFSAKDIDEFQKLLVDPSKARFKESNVKILSDISEEKPTRNSILSKLAAMSRIASQEDTILFYFSGHGYEKNGQPYLLGSDSYTNAFEETAIPAGTIRKMMEESVARVKILMLDACHSGIMKGVKDSGVMTKVFFDSLFPPPEGFVVLSSCKLGESSYEWKEKEHGVFSYYLLEGSRGAADSDGDGVVTITDVHRYVSENVKRWAFARGLEQNPMLEAKISGEIPLFTIEKPLKVEQPIDKTVIEQIVVETKALESDDDLQNALEKMCGTLLQFSESPAIDRVPNSSVYQFIYGEIRPQKERSVTRDTRWVDVVFDYVKEHWQKIDELISLIGGKQPLDRIRYRLAKTLNVERLAKKCK